MHATPPPPPTLASSPARPLAGPPMPVNAQAVALHAPPRSTRAVALDAPPQSLERWNNDNDLQLDSNRGATWTDEEEAVLVDMHKQVGKQWGSARP